MNIGKVTIYRWLNDANLAFPKIERVGKAIGMDLSEYFPKMNDPEEILLKKEVNHYK